MKTLSKRDLKDSEDEDETPLEALVHPAERPKLQISESDEKVAKSESLKVMNIIWVCVLLLVFKILTQPRLQPPKRRPLHQRSKEASPPTVEKR